MTISLATNNKSNGRTDITLRIGIAGPRRMSEQELAFGNEKLATLISNISKELTVLIQSNKLAQNSNELSPQNMPTIQLISALAIGADRLSMTPQLKHCFGDYAQLTLAGVLPFTLEKCESGLAEPTRSDAQNKQDWIDLNTYAAQIGPCLIELDGDISSPETRDQAHYKCTEYLVENIDLLVVFTKHPTAASPKLHRAGTAATMRLAKEAGRPIIQIDFGEGSDGSVIVSIHPTHTLDGSKNIEAYSGESIRKLLAKIVSHKITYN